MSAPRSTRPHFDQPLRLISWNVNSVRRRLDQVIRVIDRWEPDVICLQELKAKEDVVPVDALAAAGYTHQAIAAQPGYNGVAILSRLPLTDTETFTWAERDDARHVFARIAASGIGVHCVYVPAGGDIPDRVVNPKFDYKLRYLDALSDHFAGNYGFRDPMIMAGDLNVAPLPADVWDHAKLRNIITHTDIEIAALERVKRSLHWIDTQREVTTEDDPVFTWWSYRAADWEATNKGRRLDHIWVTPGLKDRIDDVEVLTAVRHWIPPSDHAPVMLTLAG
ncbi:MAG: exodeoxyribonuclease III [Rhodospirillaceae bacterium]|jgi:exodeoxyribonuclease III